MIGTSLPAQGESVSPRETLRIRGEQTQWRYVAFLCPHGNRSHAASEGRYRVSDLAVTAPELNAGAGVATKKGGEETLGSAPHSPFKAKASAHVRRYEAVGGRRHGAVCGVSVTSR